MCNPDSHVAVLHYLGSVPSRLLLFSFFLISMIVHYCDEKFPDHKHALVTNTNSNTQQGQLDSD